MRLFVSKCNSVKGWKGLLESMPCRRGLGVRVFEVRCSRWGVEWRRTRSQGGRGKWGIRNDRGAWEIGKLGIGGLKRDDIVSFGFCTTSFDFRIACEMALGVRNFCIVFRTVLGMRNFHMLYENFAECAKWVRRVNLFLQSVRNWFTGCEKLVRSVCEIFASRAKFSHPMRNEPWILHALRKFCRVCELYLFFLCQESLRTRPTALKFHL